MYIILSFLGCASFPTLKSGEVLPRDVGFSCGGNRTFRCLEGFVAQGNSNVQISVNSALSKSDLKCYKTDGTWILLARFMTGIGSPVYDSWLSVGTSSETDKSVEDGCTSMNYTATCTKHYRNSLVDQWTSLNITEVKLELFELGKLVAYMYFNGENTTKTSWFSPEKCTSSSWTDINSAQTFLFFSLEGHIYVPRRFYIQKNHGGCAVDAGWLSVSEASACSWDQGTSLPSFVYSPLNTYSSGSNYKSADVMAISVKAENFP